MQDKARVFVLKPNEDWIVDTIAHDFEQRTSLQVVDKPEDADIIWLLGSWCWNQVADRTKGKTVVCSVHHIVPKKFDYQQFIARERSCGVDAYFVYTHETANLIRSTNTQVPIAKVQHWVDTTRWYPVSKSVSRWQLQIPEEDLIVGSFQRDTEGSDLISPKLEKGPDLLCDLIIRMNSQTPLTVLLGGWRREYVIHRLQEAGVKYIFNKLPPQEDVRKMYAACDMYLCTARHEGGPQSILEAAAMRVPIFSTPVGIARDVLHPRHIIDPRVWLPTVTVSSDINHAYNIAVSRTPEKLVPVYDRMLLDAHEKANK